MRRGHWKKKKVESATQLSESMPKVANCTVAKMIRSSVKDLVELCQYVADRDTKEIAARSSGGVVVVDSVESFRKFRWKRRREAERLALTTGDQTSKHSKEPVEGEEDQNAKTPAVKPVNGDAFEDELEENDHHPVLRLDEFVNEFIASELDVRDVRQLPAKSADSLGAISIPSRREGHSMTLCRTNSSHSLIVFGGRLLRDLTNLLPVAVKFLDPLKLERVRYAFSNGVYSYDIETSVWTLRQCTSKPPKERSDHSAVYIHPHYLMVFGGRGRSGQVFNDCFMLSLGDWMWLELDTRTRPSPRYWHGCCLADTHLYIFGGKSESDVYGDLQQINIEKAVAAVQRQETDQSRDNTQQPTSVNLPLSWVAPHTVGKPPTARFGSRLVRIGHDRIAVVGGWRALRKENEESQRSAPRAVDMYILDTTTMVWTKPRFSSHICKMRAPPERFNFECFYAQRSVVLFGGFSYATNGETESYSARDDDRQVVYKLDVHRMIWRRQVLEGDEAALLMTEYPNFSSNSILHATKGGREHHAYACVAKGGELLLGLSTLSLVGEIDVSPQYMQ